MAGMQRDGPMGQGFATEIGNSRTGGAGVMPCPGGRALGFGGRQCPAMWEFARLPLARYGHGRVCGDGEI